VQSTTATEERNEAEPAELLTEYHRLVEREMQRDGDFLWQIAEYTRKIASRRFSIMRCTAAARVGAVLTRESWQ
jgi:hypothetical protein